MSSGASLRSFGVLLLFIGHSMVLVSGRLCSGEKTVLDANANGVKTTLVMPDKLLTGTFIASNVSIPNSLVSVTFNFGGCEIKGQMGKAGKAIYYDLEDRMTFTQYNGIAYSMSCSPTFIPDDFKYTIDVDVRLKKRIPGMKFEFDAPRKGIHDGKCECGKGLSTGWVALVVVGEFIVLAIIAFCVHWFWYRPKLNGKQTVQ